MWKQFLINFFSNKTKAKIGAIIGLVISIFVLTIGFFKTLFIVICIFLGYYIGKKKDNGENVFESFDKFVHGGWK